MRLKAKHPVVSYLWAACSDPKGPLYGSDLVPAIGDVIEVAINAIEILESIVEAPCSYDHNDFCQNHYFGRPCPHEQGLELLHDWDNLGKQSGTTDE